MKKADLFGTHKDASPGATIRKIKGILDALGIAVEAKNRGAAFGHLYWHRLSLKEIPCLGVNGKGVSRDFSRASAYAELMERLQSFALVPKSYGLMESPVLLPATKIFSFALIEKKHKKMIRKLVDPESAKMLVLKKKKFECLPYFDVKNKTVAYLPVRLVHFACSTNGMCAGNTPEEALCQGICEILERYSRKLIYEKKQLVPEVPVEFFKPCGIYQLLRKIRGEGLDLLIKDCSLGGRFPVLAVLLINKKQGGYRHAFGADPVAEAALQRCLTEILQGQNPKDVQWLALNDRASFDAVFELKKASVNNSGRLPGSMFAPAGRPHLDTAFAPSFAGHNDALCFLVNRIFAQGHDLYIRDNSFLGFPSFGVYIPGLSENRQINLLDLEIAVHLEKICGILLRLATSCRKDRQYLLHMLEKLRADPYYQAIQGNLVPFLSRIILTNSARCRKFFNLTSLLDLLGGSAGIFRVLGFPECGNCAPCPAANDCYYKNWLFLSRRIAKKIKKMRLPQEKLKSIFEGMVSPAYCRQ